MPHILNLRANDLFWKTVVLRILCDCRGTRLQNAGTYYFMSSKLRAHSVICRVTVIKSLLSVVMPIGCIAFFGLQVVDGDQSLMVYPYYNQLSDVVFFRLLTVTRALWFTLTKTALRCCFSGCWQWSEPYGLPLRQSAVRCCVLLVVDGDQSLMIYPYDNQL